MIFSKLPKAGLGNQLFVIAKALIYSEINNKKIIFLDSQQFHLGPYLRKERTKRNYSGFFHFQKGYALEWLKKIAYRKRISKIYQIEPKLEISNNNQDVIFTQIPHHSVFFDELIPWREFLKINMFSCLNKSIQERINSLEKIDVAIHVRLGDFQKLNPNKDFSKVGGTRTPFSFFLEEMEKISKIRKNAKFIIFSDGYEHELKAILDFPNSELYNSKNDIIDLYQMSKSEILITSAGSTYSYWAGFLGECQIIQHPDHFCKIR